MGSKNHAPRFILSRFILYRHFFNFSRYAKRPPRYRQRSAEPADHLTDKEKT